MAERKVKWERAPIVTITTTDRIEVRQYWYDRVNDRLRYDVVKVREVGSRKSGKGKVKRGK